ncbi:putative repeat protein (TIGR02543 family)/predicted secreted protein (Por secretion system target) [Natronoflexus pectinivorans]|uniref:Putative repeat protein (TIGR02543 family)/predicted secreted protein (Por secretion system target) n=2 Tax=Natronoflexus pectinivorans TaxID=682526 RepID=A0A4R2GNV9_9BACT|nr:putative repeat protein (TIGR02543 family)/predicted secreted protein (Por secretion system target) [Natronoflexus pectinivorans]
MNSMFSYSYFNQDISIWDVSNVENFEYFLNNSELSTENYNKMLIKWSELDLQQDISFYGGSSKYDLGLPEDRRQHIIDAFGWTFNDGGNTGNEVFLLTLYANPQDGGEVEGEGLYYEDDNIDLKAIANLGYDFTSWTDGNDEEVDSDPEFVFVMPAETVTLTANFALVDYQLTVNIDPEGAGNVSGEGIYNMNDEVTLEATANDGYEFVSWNNGEEILSVNAFYVLTMPANHINLSANFSVITSISEEPLFGHSISIYPNPTKSHIYIEGVKGNSSIEVISITGKKMMQRENQSGKVYLDVSCLDNGIYILKISSKIGVLSKKVFINR